MEIPMLNRQVNRILPNLIDKLTDEEQVELITNNLHVTHFSDHFSVVFGNRILTDLYVDDDTFRPSRPVHVVGGNKDEFIDTSLWHPKLASDLNKAYEKYSNDIKFIKKCRVPVLSHRTHFVYHIMLTNVLCKFVNIGGVLTLFDIPLIPVDELELFVSKLSDNINFIKELIKENE